MSPDTTTSRTCPTCGARVSEKAGKCPVCGNELIGAARTSSSGNPIRGSRMPELTLTLPAALGFLAIFVAIGAGAVYFILKQTEVIPPPTATPTITLTPTISPTATMTIMPTEAPTLTPEPPIDYTIQEGDTCSSVAYQFDVSINSIILMNNLGTQCLMAPGNKILIPRPTPTPTETPTSTPSGAEATDAACAKDIYTVKGTDTLSNVSLNYNVPLDAIKEANGMANDIVWEGMKLIVPLCKRNPTAGPTPTPTTPPPYPAPNLLLPADGASYTLSNENITLQWASIGTLRGNEYYQITIVDLTDPSQRRLTDYATDTKYIVPTTFRPNDNLPHVMKWWITVVRQTGNDSAGKPIYDSAGAISEQRAFSWIGAAVEATPAP